MARLSWWPRRASAWLLLSRALLPVASAYDLNTDDSESIKSVATQMAEDMLLFYHGDEPGHTPGLLELPYYWWYGGAMFGALIDYWYYTGDTRFNQLTTEGMLFQVGNERDFMPNNQTLTEGNDDQGFWGLAAMTAAEYNFPNPPDDQPQWLALAQAVFNTQAARWDSNECDGGLRWQIFTWNNGYDYKNSISQACFFALAARLALFTGNTSYADWAERTWDWMVDVQFIEADTYYVYDGAGTVNNCSGIVPYQWTYNAGGFLLGAAAMYNFTGNDKWKTRIDGMVQGADVFFTGEDSNIMTEVACEPVNFCNYDQESFKAYLSRWLAVATKWAPHTADHIRPRLQASAIAAAQQCTGGANGRMCGLKWTNNSGTWDGTTGLGHQMAALEIVLTQLAHTVGAPLTEGTGATSQGDPSAGGGDIGRTQIFVTKPITAGDRAGAAILTILLLAGLFAGVAFMVWDETTDKTMAERWQDVQDDVKDFSGVASTGAAAILHRNKKGGGFDEKGKGVMALPVSEPAAAAATVAIRENRQSLSPPVAEMVGARRVSVSPMTSVGGSSMSVLPPEEMGVAQTHNETSASNDALMTSAVAVAQAPPPLPPKPARLSKSSMRPNSSIAEPAWSAQPHRPVSFAEGPIQTPQEQDGGIRGRRRTLTKRRTGSGASLSVSPMGRGDGA